MWCACHQRGFASPNFCGSRYAAGKRSLVPALARAALAVGAHGIMVEIDGEPEKAKSDGPQSLDFEGFAELMKEIRAIAAVLHRDSLFAKTEEPE